MGLAITGLLFLVGIVVFELLKVLLLPLLLIEIAWLDKDKVRYSREEAQIFLLEHKGQSLKVPSSDRLAESLGKPAWEHVLLGIDKKSKKFTFEDGAMVPFENVIPHNSH